MIIRIQTRHLLLRLLQRNDIDYLEKLNGDPEVMKFFPKGTQTRAQVKARIEDFISGYEKSGTPVFTIFTLDTKTFVGRCGFSLLETGEIEVGYVLDKQFWGKGYATELLTALLAWAKDNVPHDRIVAYAPAGHRASQRVMEKVGMNFLEARIAQGVACHFYEINLKS